MATAQLRLESPFPEHAWPMVWTWIEKFRARVCDDFAPKTQDEYVEEALARAGHEKTWGVWRGDELGGLIVFQPWNPIVGTSHFLFKPAFWGPAITIPALRMAYDELFGVGWRKIVAMVFADNEAVKALALKLGAKQHKEPLREHTMRDGKPLDVVILELFRECFYAAIS